MIVNMDEWVRDGVAPPPSSYPRLDDGTLVARDKLSFPKIPDVNLPQTAYQVYRVDYGPSGREESSQPADKGWDAVPVFVPQVDRDGIELAELGLPELVVPVATYTGWNLRDATPVRPGRASVSSAHICLWLKPERTRTAQ